MTVNRVSVAALPSGRAGPPVLAAALASSRRWIRWSFAPLASSCRITRGSCATSTSGCRITGWSFASLALAAAFGAGADASAADGAAVPAFSAAPVGDAPAAWRFASLPRKTPTAFAIVEQGGAHVLKVEASDSYGNLVYPLHATLTEQATLAWRWRVDQLVDTADLRSKGGDDSPARICLFFSFDAGKLSLGERTRLALAKSTTGQDVPAQTLCYVWDNKLPVDTALNNAFTARVRVIVLQSGSGKLGQWAAQKRNVVADYQRLFGDESEGKVPEVTGVAVSADADNTHGHSVAYFGDVVLTP